MPQVTVTHALDRKSLPGPAVGSYLTDGRRLLQVEVMGADGVVMLRDRVSELTQCCRCTLVHATMRPVCPAASS